MNNISKQLRQTLLRTLWLAAGLLLSNAASAITVTASPAACTNVSWAGGNQPWSSSGRATSSNNSYATASVDGSTTRYLRCTRYNFAIPAGAIINGITVHVERKSSSTNNGGSRDAAMRLVKAGVIGTADRSTATTYTTSNVIEAHGGATDLWGATWIAANINASNFGAAFAATKASAAGAAHTISVDHVRITVDYSLLPPGIYTVAASPTTCANASWPGSTRNWSNPAQAISGNNSYATASVDGTTTRFLRCTGYNFDIPAGAIINGIAVNVERKSGSTSNGGSRDAAMRLVKAGSIGTTDRSTATIYTTTDVIEAHGGAADLWGTTWTAANINTPNFGAAFAATKASRAGPAHTISVDHIPITVTFTIPGLDHYEFSLQTNSITCLPSTVTVTACADNSSPCTNRYTAASGSSATLSTSAGALADTTVTFGATGVASTTLSYPLATDGATASVTLSSVPTTATNSHKCCPDGINCAVADNCSTTFKTAGFIFSDSASGIETTIPTQIAGTLSSTYFLRAIKTNTATQTCESALMGTSATTSVNFAYQCNNPISCYAANLMSVNGTPIERNNNGSLANFTSVDMTFDANGNAPFKFKYDDVGYVRLHVKKLVNSALLTGASNPFVVRPHHFDLSAIKCTTANAANCAAGALPTGDNPGASNSDGASFIQAGNAFSVTVTARDSNNNVTPNYGQESTPESIKLTPVLVAPLDCDGIPANDPDCQIPAIGGDFDTRTDGYKFANGVATGTSFTWGEVGIIKLTPSVGDGDYLGAGNVTGAQTSNIGRFIPHHFALLSGSAVTAACGGITGFTYMGQPNLSESYEIEAQNTANGKTMNYTGDFVKAAITNITENNDNDLSTRLSVPGGTWSQGKYTVSTSTANFSRPATTSPDATWGAFDNLQIGVNLVDTDGAVLLDLNMNPATAGACGAACSGKRIGDDETVVPSTPRTTRMRFGRLRMNNAYGSELLPLPVPLLAQYWNGTGFILNTDDSCTQVPVPVPVAITTPLSPGLTFYAPPTTATNALQAGQTTATLNTPFISGNGGLRLSTPGLGNYGYVDVLITTPDYLQYNWNGTATAGNFFDDNPGARATFGKYKQRNELIYMREIH